MGTVASYYLIVKLITLHFGAQGSKHFNALSKNLYPLVVTALKDVGSFLVYISVRF